MVTEKKWNYVFGPVPSRRLGLSLGVDIIPKKVCTLDCVYCEVGTTDKRALRRREYFPADAIIAEVEQALAAHSALDYISFSGSGEPTLNAKLGEMIRAVKQMTSIPVAVITNGTLLSFEDVRYDLVAADVVLPSLDAASQDVFEKIDRPHPQLRIDQIIEGLRVFRSEYKGQVWLEIMFAKGYNDHEGEVLKLKEAVASIRPDKVQLNTVIRPPSVTGVEPVSLGRLKEIQALVGGQCEIIGSFEKSEKKERGNCNAAEILSLLERRAMTLEGLADSQGVSPQHMFDTLKSMKGAGLVVSFIHQGEEHFRVKEEKDPELQATGEKNRPAKKGIKH
ncbi:MAG TPA: radical SAM protein [Bacteroidota bacterium]|nr:radical SAM protein [Bacteroidota bacterium]